MGCAWQAGSVEFYISMLRIELTAIASIMLVKSGYVFVYSYSIHQVASS